MKKIWETIKNALKGAWAGFKDFCKKVYARILAIGTERWFNFALGLIITAFSAIVWKIEWAPALPVALAIIWAFRKVWLGKKLDWKNYVALAIGAAIIWIFTII